MTYKVLDISKHQYSFNAAKAKAEGVDAVIIRLAYGASQDTTSCNWANNIKATGFPLGGYGFATWHYREVFGGSIAAARRLMRSQVAAWIRYAKETGVNWCLAIDQELETNKGYHMGLSMDENTTLITEAAELIKAAGFTPVLYCSMAWDAAYIRTINLPNDLTYWFAWYLSAVDQVDFDGVSLSVIPDGVYGRWFNKCLSNGRLMGWQYDSTGYGAKYGAGSVNIDRSLKLNETPKEPVAIKPDDIETPVDGLYTITVTASKGDRDAVIKFCKEHEIPCRVE